MSQVELINQEINQEISKPEVQRALLATTFKGLQVNVMKQAIMEGMIRGFSFKDFLEKNVYAIPFRDGYSLISSIDHVRKIAMRSGLVGKSEPKFTYMTDGKIESCTITIKKQTSGTYVGEYTATVYFDEYYKAGKNGYPSLWDSKPRTMIAKVAEMHALRQAFPEEMAKQYVEEEMQKSVVEVPIVDTDKYKSHLLDTENMEQLQKVWANMPIEAKNSLKELKEELKQKYANV